jgi:hypothetical protein
MPQNKAILFFLGLVMITWGCKSSSKVGTAEKSKNEALELIEILKNKQVNPDWMIAKTKIVYQSGGTMMSGQGLIRMKMDSALVVSVRKFSIEVAKLKIDRDSIFFVDRINSQFVEESLARGAEIIGFPANFDLIQSIVLGRLPNTLLESSQVFKNEKDLNLILKGYSSTVVTQVDPQNFNIHSVQFYDHINDFQILNKLEDYQIAHQGKSFSLNREFVLKMPSSDSLQININFLQIEWDQPADLNISIPKSYSRAAY